MENNKYFNREAEEKLVTVIVPVYNTEKKFILECLDSVANQTLDKKDYDLLIIDDCSNNSETTNLLKQLSKDNKYKGVDMKIITHEKNKWVSEVRKTGAKNAKGEFIVFLDSDDLIEKDYLKKSALLLKTSPKAGWIYPNIRMFGYFDHFLYAPQFNALKLFLNNYCVSASLYRKSAWIQVSQREKFVIKNVRFFEDWDTTIRLMSKGWFGLPLNDSDFRYRQHYKSMVIRTSKILALTIYIVWRSNIVTFLKIFKAQIRYNRDFEEG